MGFAHRFFFSLFFSGGPDPPDCRDDARIQVVSNDTACTRRLLAAVDTFPCANGAFGRLIRFAILAKPCGLKARRDYLGPCDAACCRRFRILSRVPSRSLSRMQPWRELAHAA